jgi:hypothetical protein
MQLKMIIPVTCYVSAKHQVKVHVWAGISWVRATEIVIFEGMMDAQGYIDGQHCCHF